MIDRMPSPQSPSVLRVSAHGVVVALRLPLGFPLTRSLNAWDEECDGATQLEPERTLASIESESHRRAIAVSRARTRETDAVGARLRLCRLGLSRACARLGTAAERSTA